MVIIGMVLLWSGYSLGLWGYCLVNGYDVSFGSLFHSDWPAGGSKTGAPAPSGPGITSL